MVISDSSSSALCDSFGKSANIGDRLDISLDNSDDQEDTKDFNERTWTLKTFGM